MSYQEPPHWTEKLVESVKAVGAEESKSRGAWTIGELLANLDARDHDCGIHVEIDGKIVGSLTHPHSYRGHYERLALEIGGHGDVSDVRVLLRGSIGETFEGYKGGSFTMANDTILHVANYGESSDVIVTGVRDMGPYECVIETGVDHD